MADHKINLRQLEFNLARTESDSVHNRIRICHFRLHHKILSEYSDKQCRQNLL